MHFGTLFLSTYRMPRLEDVIRIIGNGVSIFTMYFPYASVGCILRKLIDEVLQRSDDLIAFSKGRFLKKFNDHLNDYQKAVAPVNREGSPLSFFLVFFNRLYTPCCDDEIDLIVEWTLFTVQFEEANEKRTRQVIKFLEDLREYLYVEKCKAMLDPRLDNIDKPSLMSKEASSKQEEDSSKQEEPILYDTLTKPCDCLEYEKSGDCYCLD